jgi:hypothetical protein
MNDRTSHDELRESRLARLLPDIQAPPRKKASAPKRGDNTARSNDASDYTESDATPALDPAAEAPETTYDDPKAKADWDSSASSEAARLAAAGSSRAPDRASPDRDGDRSRQPTDDQRRLRATYERGGYHIARRGGSTTWRIPGQRIAGRLVQGLRRGPAPKLGTWATSGHQIGLSLERALLVPLRDLQAAINAGRHRTDEQVRIVARLAEYLLRYTERGAPKPLLADALGVSDSTIKRLLKGARATRKAGIDPWTGESEVDPGDGAETIVRRRGGPVGFELDRARAEQLLADALAPLTDAEREVFFAKARLVLAQFERERDLAP